MTKYPYIDKNTVQVVRLKTKHADLKHQAHKFFDVIWQNKLMERNQLYQHISEWLGVPEPKVHMSVAKHETLVAIIKRSIQILNDNRRLDLDFGSPIITPYFELRYKGKKIND